MISTYISIDISVQVSPHEPLHQIESVTVFISLWTECNNK